MKKQIAKAWTFASSSGRGEYQTLLYTDGSTSCECKGWTRRCTYNVRTCKHTRCVEMGRADEAALSFVDYARVKVPVYAKEEPTRQEPEGRRVLLL